MMLETNEKVLAMYQAVCSLIEEGCDIHKLKVADITAKAGIGKGTAYEYFRSKDELLIRALQYDYYVNCLKIEEALKKGKNFRETVEAMFSQIEQCKENKRLVMQVLKILSEVREKDKNCVREHITKEIQAFTEILDYMITMGKEEGCINKSLPEKFARVEMSSKFVGYYMFLQSEKLEETEKTAMKEFLFEIMKKSLS